jgi:TonB-dependent receptor
MKKFLFLLYCIVLAVSQSSAQSGSLQGKVTDEANGEDIVGANVLVMGTNMGGVSDLDGKFLIRNIPVGTYTVKISYVGYGTKSITGIVIKDREVVNINVALAIQTVEAQEVVVTAERVLATEAAILSERKKAATIGDGISAEQIKRAPDATSGDALKRVTGLAIVDNKFVFIRGVTDRYNGTMLNGVSVSTTDTDVDKKSFSFDIVPANLLENTVVTKTATPDLPGDFTGGLVQLNTLDFPNRRIVKLSLSTSYNTISNLTTVQKSQSGGSDWTGFDDGTRAYPNTSLNGYELGKSLPNNWAQRSSRAPLNGSFNLSIGDALPIGEDQLGYVAALSYRNGYQRTQAETDYFRTGSRILEASGTRDQFTVLWGGLLDVNFKFSGMHKISFKNNYNQTAEDKASFISGVDENDQTFRTQVTEWDQRSLYVTGLSGDHKLPELFGLELQWKAGYAQSLAKEPDRKTAVYSKNVASVNDPYIKGHTDRSWSDLREFTRTASIDFTLPVENAKIKFGALAEGKKRNYDIQFFVPELERGSRAFELTLLPIDSIFMPNNFGPGKFVMSRLDNPQDKYSASQNLYAGYFMVDLPFNVLDQSFRFVGGARLENSKILVNTLDPYVTNKPYVARLEKVDVLPSLNLTYLVTENMNLRLAYSQSVNRPEFRELANHYFYDYSIYEGVYGNPLLRRAFSKNYDIRFEMFPSIGELLAVSYFNKSISGAIEQQLIISSNPERTWFNSPRGTNYGYELEIRKSLDFLGGYLANFSITGNYTRVFSSIEYPIFFGATEFAKREMQGQSPYMLNLSLLFNEPSLGTSVNILYNAFGERLDAVGDDRAFDVLEEARGVLDASISQPIMSGLELKFTAKDIGASLKKFRTREGNPYRTLYQGTTYSLQASLSF